MQHLARRDMLAILGSMGGIVLLAWVYLVMMAIDMQTMANMPAMPAPTWDGAYFVLMFLMWAIMMVGMMLPSVVPTVLIYASVARKAGRDGLVVAPTALFVAGYLAMWILFSILATSLQWLFDLLGLLTPTLAVEQNDMAATILILVGLYQCLPLKDACLQQCRSPVEFISHHWRAGRTGAFVMGVHHGLFCVGCCWLLMGLLFFGGVMNLLWIAAITVFVLLEKLLPWGAIGGRLTGLLMLGSGLLLLLLP